MASTPRQKPTTDSIKKKLVSYAKIKNHNGVAKMNIEMTGNSF